MSNAGRSPKDKEEDDQDARARRTASATAAAWGYDSRTGLPTPATASAQYTQMAAAAVGAVNNPLLYGYRPPSAAEIEILRRQEEIIQQQAILAAQLHAEELQYVQQRHLNQIAAENIARKQNFAARQKRVQEAVLSGNETEESRAGREEEQVKPTASSRDSQNNETDDTALMALESADELGPDETQDKQETSTVIAEEASEKRKSDDSQTIPTANKKRKRDETSLKQVRSPESVFAAPGCVAQTLNISDQHATILLEQASEDGSEKERSLLKLTLVPFHLEQLPRPGEEGDNESSKIVSFLSNYNFHRTSESGAEYSYYDASPKAGLFHRLFRPFLSFRSTNTETNSGSYKVELISPASERQVKRAMPSPSFVLIEETPHLNETVTKPHIESVIQGGSLSWLANVVKGKKERERLLLDTDDFILNIDTKWRSHPDPNAVPRSKWYQHESVVDLYCLAIIKENGVASLRDLEKRHVPVLRSIVNEGPAAIQKIYGVPRDQLRIFVHYLPQFYHFHVHFTRLENDVGCQVERGHLVTDIIQNLVMDGEFYSKRTISYKLPANDKLYSLIKAAQDDGLPSK